MQLKYSHEYKKRETNMYSFQKHFLLFQLMHTIINL
jgi:hypothetical protein